MYPYYILCLSERHQELHQRDASPRLRMSSNVPCYYYEAVNRATPRSTVGGGGGASGGGNGNGNGKSTRSPAPATSKSRRTVSSTSPSKASSSTKTGSSITPPSPAARSLSTLGAAGGRRRPPHAPPGVSISPTSPPAPGSRSQTRRKDRFLMRTPPGSSVSRTRPKTAGHSPLLVGSGAKARPPLVPGDKVRSEEGRNRREGCAFMRVCFFSYACVAFYGASLCSITHTLVIFRQRVCV